MRNNPYGRFTVVVAAVVCLFVATAFAQNGNAGKKTYTFKGKVEKVDVAAKKARLKAGGKK